jgi:peptidoglycan/LPS O-acetylase OafA/YrhL
MSPIRKRMGENAPMAGTLGYSSTRALTGDPVGGRARSGDPEPADIRLDPIEPADPVDRAGARRAHPSLRSAALVKVPYLPGLDGLRALAVMSVLLYHGDVASLKGGFLGVEVFFVISGYLITAILLAERKNSFRIDLKRFYSRRAKRLLPALFLTLFLAMLITAIFFRDELATLRGDTVSSLLYVTNWFFVFGQKSYFESVGRPSLVQHLWSLAVEEQFYLLWPLIFAAGMRFLGRKRLFIATLVGALLSTVLMAVLYHPGVDPSRVYYGTDTRAAGLLIGAALAFVWAPYRLTRSVGRGAPLALNAVGVLSLGVLVWMLFVTDQFSDWLYRGGFLRVSLVTALLIAVVVHPAAKIGKYLGMRPLRWVGLRSYGIYLYHWPIFQLTRPQLDVPLTGTPLLVLRLLLTFAVATVSYKYVETPIRTGALTKRWAALRASRSPEAKREKSRWIGGTAVLAATLSVLVVVAVRAEPPPPPDYLIAAGTADPGLPPAAVLPPAPAATPTTVDAAGAGDAQPGTSTTVAPGDGVIAGDGTSTTTADPSVTTTAVPPPTDPVTTDPATGAPVTTASTVPPGTRRITAIGDSVMLGSIAKLNSTLPGSVFVDARVGRQVSECLQILTVWRDRGLLGDVVVVHIGNNGTFTEDQFNQMKDILSGVPKVIFINNKVPRSWEAGNNQVITDGAASMPNAVLIDWKSAGDAHPEWFAKDGMHMGTQGAQEYAWMINAQL